MKTNKDIEYEINDKECQLRQLDIVIESAIKDRKYLEKELNELYKQTIKREEI